MVRKPELVPPPLSQATYHPPYPTTPPDEHPPPFPADASGYQFVSHEDARRSESDDDISSSSDWDEPEDDDEDQKGNIPAALRPGGHRPTSSQQVKPDELPALLRVGPPGGSPAPRISIDSEDDRAKAEEKTEEKKPEPHSSATSPPPALTTPPPPAVSPPAPAVSTPPPSAGPASESPATTLLERRPTIPLKSQNPYLNIQSPSTGQSADQDNAPKPWSQEQPIPQEPIEMPLDNSTPVEQFSNMSLANIAEDRAQSPPTKPPPGVPGDVVKQTTADVTSPTSPSQRHASDASSVFYPGMDVSSLDGQSSRTRGLPEDSEAQPSRTWQEQQAWEKSERERREREAAAAQEKAMQEERERQAEEEWHRGEAAAKAAEQSQPPTRPTDDTAPPLPPRPGTSSTTAEQAPSRPHNIGTADGAESPGTKQRKENYSIKHIRWFDSHTNNLREAPVLTQNANGPCPLLALVNALVLSTPARQQSSLMDALKTRETISLGLLLDTVFDELVSGHRGTVAQELPDVGDLYAFLLALHTGMNVNPQFVAAGSEGLIDHPISQGQSNPGSFEQTREMRLYSTFKVPLIHGWIPPPDSIATAAFGRSAKTYEDAQNIQFHEEELEAKLSTSGLSPQEQNLYEDLQAIKEFLHRYPTQLTDYGLKVMKDSLKPGQFAILFRNDHFSTIYKEPRSQKVFSLVTDTGYSSHEEIVWESLVDVTGRGSEMFSGDFRAVSHNQGTGQERPIRSLLDDEPPRQGSGFANGGGVTYPQENGTVGATPSTEQEDADLALALQLQEEEDDRHRREAEERRRRENELSHNFLSNEAITNVSSRPGRITDPIRGSDVRPLIPPRRNNNNNNNNNNVPQTNRPRVDGEEPPPPTYEQAANSPVYVPGQGGQGQGQGLPNPPQGGAGAPHHGRGQSAYASTSSSQGQSYFIGGRPSGRGRRTSHPAAPAPAAGSVAAGPSGGGGVPYGRRHSGSGGQQQGGGAPGKEEKCVYGNDEVEAAYLSNTKPTLNRPPQSPMGEVGNPKPYKTSSGDWWEWELFGIVGSAVALGGIILVLCLFLDKPQPSWEHISLNALISWLSTVAKLLVLIPITRSLGQLKWVWFKQKHMPLLDMEVFDSASRGVLGSFSLLWRLKCQ
ncbi:hypothetical protein SLS55_003842 [Diplodia seriata]|uniref:MINDY deubiquitinase domain-containing protein n=1 Tax=Diplodia seriata TaxID=420778 RepID=A0ABR3CQ31_9PEZI